jgi:beta-lactamase regulating signal transducer with metallopeptidase domain
MERALAEYVVNALWQLPVLAAGAWLFVRLARPSPRMQHGIWLAVLALAVLLPGRGLRKAEPAQATAMVSQESAEIGEEPLPFFARTRDLTLNATVSRWLVRIYLATVVLALLRIARAWHAAHRLVGHSRETFRHRAELADLSSRFAVKLPQLRESEAVSSPMVVGVGAPVVLLPEGFDRFTEDEVRAALCHELAHVKRLDYLMNLVCQVAAAPLAWHPVVHEVQHRIRMTREMVCDAMAAQEMESEISYAKCLLALAHSMLPDPPGQAQFLGLFSKNTLEERVMRLLETTKMSMRAKVARVATGAAVMIATGSLAVIFHVTPTMAEQTTGAPPPAVNVAAGQAQPEVAAPVAPAAPSKPAHARHATRSRKDKQQIDEAQQKMAKAGVILDDPEFNQRMEDAQRQMAKANAIMDSPEFKQRMEDAERQMEKATAVFDGPAFKQQMENAQRQMEQAKAILDNPEFKKKMEDAQREMAKAAEMFNSPDFKERIQDEVKRKAEEDSRRIEAPSLPEETAPNN